MEDATRAVARAAYKRGAKYVDVFWWDHLVKAERLRHADEATLDFVPPWIEQRMQWLSDERAARVTLTGTSAAVFDGIDPARTGRDLLPYISAVPRIVNERTTNWTARPVPESRLGAARPSGARAGRGARQALGGDRLRAPARRRRSGGRLARADDGDRRERATGSPSAASTPIHLQGPGTDLTIGLMPSSQWLGARLHDGDGDHSLSRTSRPRRSSRHPIRSGWTDTSPRRCRSSSTART